MPMSSTLLYDLEQEQVEKCVYKISSYQACVWETHLPVSRTLQAMEIQGLKHNTVVLHKDEGGANIQHSNNLKYLRSYLQQHSTPCKLVCTIFLYILSTNSNQPINQPWRELHCNLILKPCCA